MKGRRENLAHRSGGQIATCAPPLALPSHPFASYLCVSVAKRERERLTDRLTAFPRRDVLRLRESAEGHETREKDATR